MVVRFVWPSRQLSPQVSPLGPIARYRSLPAGPGTAIPPRRVRQAPGWLRRMLTARGDIQGPDRHGRSTAATGVRDLSGRPGAARPDSATRSREPLKSGPVVRALGEFG